MKLKKGKLLHCLFHRDGETIMTFYDGGDLLLFTITNNLFNHWYAIDDDNIIYCIYNVTGSSPQFNFDECYLKPEKLYCTDTQTISEVERVRLKWRRLYFNGEYEYKGS